MSVTVNTATDQKFIVPLSFEQPRDAIVGPVEDFVDDIIGILVVTNGDAFPLGARSPGQFLPLAQGGGTPSKFWGSSDRSFDIFPGNGKNSLIRR